MIDVNDCQHMAACLESVVKSMEQMRGQSTPLSSLWALPSIVGPLGGFLVGYVLRIFHLKSVHLTCGPFYLRAFISSH